MTGVYVHVDPDAEIRIDRTGYTRDYQVSVGDVVIYLPPAVAEQLRDQLIEKLG